MTGQALQIENCKLQIANWQERCLHQFTIYNLQFAICNSACLLALAITGVALAAEPCQSGLQPGQRPGPYAFLVATGPQRGQQHCYVCETAQRPAIIVFARGPSDPLAHFLKEVDKALVTHKKAELRAWTTFLADNQPELDGKLVQWARQHGLSNLPVGVFEDAKGPPSYRLNAEADVTVLLAVNQKVVVNFAFRAGELTEAKAKDVLAALPKILPQN